VRPEQICLPSERDVIKAKVANPDQSIKPQEFEELVLEEDETGKISVKLQ
jgi:hypothetical protein